MRPGRRADRTGYRVNDKVESCLGNLGVFVSATDTSFRIGSGIGLNIDTEEALGLDATNTVFRADALWRFTDNKRHRLDFTWFSLN